MKVRFSFFLKAEYSRATLKKVVYDCLSGYDGVAYNCFTFKTEMVVVFYTFHLKLCSVKLMQCKCFLLFLFS